MEIEPELPDWQPDKDNLVTHYIKKYPDRLKLIQFKTPYSDKPKPKDPNKPTVAWLQAAEEKADSLADSLQRTRTRLSDLVICNDFDLFVTLTLNCRACMPKCDNKLCTCDIATCKRYDLDYALRTVKGWYNNQIKNPKIGRFPYVQVMELHKKGGYHFHALFKDYKGKLKFAQRDKKDGRPIYNLVSYRKGYSTAKKIYSISGASSYVRKYIEKEMPVYPDKKRYWCSQGLKRPIIVQDEKLAEQILQNPDSQTYKPDKVTLRDDGSLKNNTSNLESITTLLTDNKADYLYELEVLECLEEFSKATDG
jgi:hypothetical protein